MRRLYQLCDEDYKKTCSKLERLLKIFAVHLYKNYDDNNNIPTLMDVELEEYLRSSKNRFLSDKECLEAILSAINRNYPPAGINHQNCSDPLPKGQGRK